ncbi:MAG: hypothetical protein P8Z70_11305, partial [Desulfuromonadales bacterium]
MKKLAIFLGVMMVLGYAGSALAVDVTVHGDLNNRFNLYTNQSQMYAGAETVAKSPVISHTDNSAFWGDIKYRLWTELATNDGAIKGVYAIELGALRFGQNPYGKGGGATYSGDGVNIETRWAYTDFQLPFVQQKARVQIGLIPFKVNHYVWQETVMGVQLAGDAGGVGYKLAWVRGKEFYPTTTEKNAFQDQDAILLRGDLKPMEGTKAGVFALYQHNDANGNNGTNDASTNYEIKRFGADKFDLYTIGTDGDYTTPTGFGNAFLNWDLIYQGGKVDIGGDNIWGDAVNGEDVSAYFLHADLGVNIGKTRLTYTTWYASGDDDATDGHINNFMSTDVDMFDSIVLFEGGYTDDNYFTEAPYILDKGMYLNKLAADYKATDKTSLGAAVLYLRTAEDFQSVGGNDSKELGTEIDAYVSHKLFPNTKVDLNFGYLFSGNAMDNFAENGNSENIYRSTA